MGAIVISSDNVKNLNLLAELAQRLGENVSKLTTEQFDDLQFGELIKKEKTGKAVSRKNVFNYLESK